VADPKKQVPPQYVYRAQRGRSALKGVGINTKPPKLKSAGTRPLAVGA